MQQHVAYKVRGIVYASVGLFAVHIASSHAEESSFRFSGFGTVGAVHENAADAGFVRNASQPQAETNNTSYLTDTLLGLQGNYSINPQFELVGQLVARDQKNITVNRALEWAYVHWRPTEHADVRLGRVGVDTFMLSDYRHVGFAQTWVRPPNEFYSWIPMYSVNGGDATYHLRHGDTHWHLKGQLGSSESRLPTGPDAIYELKIKEVRNISLRADNGPWQFMTAYSMFKVDSEAIPSTLNSNLAAIAGNGGAPTAIRNEARQLNSGLYTKGAEVRYQMLGAAYQDGTWQFQTEIAKVTADTQVFPNGTTGYAMVGRRFGSLTPYVIAAEFRPDKSAVTAQTSWSALGSSATSLQNTAVASYNSYHIEQRSLSLGTRWDVTANTAFKVQWDRKHIAARGYGLWQVDNTMHGDRPQNVNVFSAVLDFTF